MPKTRLRKNRYQGKGAKARARKIRRHNDRIRHTQAMKNPIYSSLAGALQSRTIGDDVIQDALSAFEGRPSHLLGDKKPVF